MNSAQIIPPGINPKKETREITFKVLAGIGVAVILVALIWVGVRTAQNLPDGTSGIAGALTNIGSRERIVVTADPAVATSTDTVTVSWEHLNKKEDGSYTLRYDCHDGLELIATAGDNEETIFCNVPFNTTGVDNILEVRAVSESAARAETNIAIDFTRNGSRNISETGETLLVVINPDLMEEATVAGTSTPVEGPAAPETNNTTGSVVPAPAPQPTQTFTFGPTSGAACLASNPNGTADLTLVVIDTGTANSRGEFTHKDPVDTDDTVAVKFLVSNNGTKDTGPWDFEAHLPTRPSRDFSSPTQDSLCAGGSREYILSFTRVQRDPTVTVRIELDPDDTVDEISESNNSESETINVDD
ncbi:hypothetical protein L0Y40_01975 [Candidatus Wolfebacteria bacterium]|nr:hypothetical protein [Candidatus Wolfebacteria bacterium]